MSAGGSMLSRIHARAAKPPRPETPGKGRRGPPRVGIDLIAIAEEVLFPGVPSAKLTGAQQAQAARMAKAHLIAIGKWPESMADRDDATRTAARPGGRA